MQIETAENILDIYSLEDILDLNDLTEADVLCFLVNENVVELPNPLPLSLKDLS